MLTCVNDICAVLDSWAPENTAQNWDNVGLMLGSRKSVVKRVMVALDFSPKVAEQIESHKVDMLITHHPLFFTGVKSFTVSDQRAAAICTLIKGDVAVYSAHTNLDAAAGGVNDVLAEKLGLLNVTRFSIEADDNTGIGRVGVLSQPQVLGAFAQKVKEVLGAERVTYADAGQLVHKVAIIGGSGADYYEAASSTGADTLVTGDVKYHTAQNAVNYSINIIDGTHQLTELPVVEQVAAKLRKWAAENERELEVLVAEENIVLQVV